MNREMSRKNGDGADKLRPGEKIALRLKENGVPIQSMQAGIDDVAREKIKTLTKYCTSLSVLYQQSIAELKGHSENRTETSSDTGHRRRSPPENGGTSHLLSPLWTTVPLLFFAMSSRFWGLKIGSCFDLPSKVAGTLRMVPRTKCASMGWRKLVGTIKLQVCFAKETYKRDKILQKRPIILSILLTVATPYTYLHMYTYVSLYTPIHLSIWLSACSLSVCRCVAVNLKTTTSLNYVFPLQCIGRFEEKTQFCCVFQERARFYYVF